MILESYNTANISITQDVPSRGCPGRFIRLLCSERDWRII